MMENNKPNIVTLKTRDGLEFTYRDATSDIKAIREACGNIDMEGEKKRSSSYTRTARAPLFKIEKDDVWLDCGAHIGSFALRAAKNGCKKVIAIEPEDDNYDLLIKNISNNNMSHVIHVEKCVVVGTKTESNLLLNKTSSTYRHTLLPVKKVCETQKVACKTLKEFLQEYPEINAVKIDIEGSERDVISSVDWKDTNVSKIVFEYSFDHHPVMNDFHDLVDKLKTQFDGVYHIPSLPPRGKVWDTKITRGANGSLVWSFYTTTVNT